MSESECVCFFTARVRSGPRPPPRAPSPWQRAQLMRNSYSPAFAALASPARGLRSSAAQAATSRTRNTTTAAYDSFNIHHLPGMCGILRYGIGIEALEILAWRERGPLPRLYMSGGHLGPAPSAL